MLRHTPWWKIIQWNYRHFVPESSSASCGLDMLMSNDSLQSISHFRFYLSKLKKNLTCPIRNMAGDKGGLGGA